MDIKKKNLSDSKVELVVTVAWSDWKKFVDKAAAEISKNVKVEGFRAGKVPRSVIEQKFGSEAILNGASEEVVRSTYPEVLKKENVDAIGAPQVEILKLAEGNDFEYKVIVDVMPKVTLKDWKKAVAEVNKKNATEKAEVSDEEISKELEQLAGYRSTLNVVDREAKNGDSVEIDFDVLQGGVPIEGGSSKGHNLVLGSGVFIPGFEEQLIGSKAGDKKEFELNFPKEYHAKHLAGAPALFKVKVNLVQEKVLPEINDEFAKSLGKFENLDALKENMRKGMTEEKEHALSEKKRADIVEKLVENIEVEIPEILLTQELERMVSEFEQQVYSMGMTLDNYLEKMGKTQEDLRKDWKPSAEKRIKSAMALEEIAKVEGIESTSEEIEAEMNKTLQMYKNVKDAQDKIDMQGLFVYAKGVIQNKKVFEMLEKI